MTYEKDIAKAVDDYIEMERKAKAWDRLYATYEACRNAEEMDLMDDILEQAK